MPTPKTECTELSVGFGILDLEPLEINVDELDLLWAGSLSEEKYERFISTLQSDESFYRRFHSVGVNIRHFHEVLSKTNIHSITWEGPNQQASAISMAKDLLVANVAISVKANSDVVFNLSPHSLLDYILAGKHPPQRAENWYTVTARNEYQQLYQLAVKLCELELPDTVNGYHSEFRGASRKVLSGGLRKLEKRNPEKYRLFQNGYTEFCHRVARVSADRFNQAFAQSMSSGAKNAILDNIARYFLRLGDTEYVLCGLEKRSKEFSVSIPDLSSWKRRWRLESVEAQPDLDSGQSLVRFELCFQNRQTKAIHVLKYHVQIRWSHGKFVGNPEAKFYKDFSWIEVPFFTKIRGQNSVIKSKLINTGGYGNVYEGSFNGKKVAIKELTVRYGASTQDTQEDRDRFRREVEIQSKLNHPNIVPVIVSDLASIVPWFAMPLADESLSDIIVDLSSDHERINSIFMQMIQAIKYAHDSNVIHRDIKPGNVLLFEGNHVMVTDFGLGKRLIEEDGQAITRSSNNAYGSYGYAAPEQFGAFREADQRADIYALGQTLLHMATGEEPPSPLALDNIPQQYLQLIKRCIAENPVDRFQDLDELITAFKGSSASNGGEMVSS